MCGGLVIVGGGGEGGGVGGGVVGYDGLLRKVWNKV